MPHRLQPATAEVRVMLKGESSRPEASTYKDYIKTYFTDYAPKSTGMQGRVTQGRVHKLTARATKRVTLPIEYVTEYNLAGGDGLTYTVKDFISRPQPPGAEGALRFANSHNNDQSGYYNWYKVAGHYDSLLNPGTTNLSNATLVDTDGASITLRDKYFIPARDQWWGIWPAIPVNHRDWVGAKEILDYDEIMAVGSGGDILRQLYSSDYSQSLISPRGGNSPTDNAVFYAIPFKAKASNCTPMSNYLDGKHYLYFPAIDNSLKCAYRFTRVGGASSWGTYTNQNMTNRLIIDVVYLGEEDTPTGLSPVSDEAWWAARLAEDRFFLVPFPLLG